MKFLGIIIDEQVIHADPTKAKAISEFPPPQNVTLYGDGKPFGEVHSPAGRDERTPASVVMQRHHMANGPTPKWRAFEQIKTTLTSAEVLACYDPSRPTIIVADASLNGIGAVLLQVQDDGNRRPISYAS